MAQYTYDGIGRLTQTILSDRSAADNTIRYFYESDSALDLLSHDLRNSANDVAYGFDYNAANQVTVRTVDNGAYQYDGLADKAESYTANGLNQYTDITKDGILVGLTYDDAGNLLSDGTWTYTYDVENRLTSASDGVTTATYDYDPVGRRVAKTVNGTSTYYLSDGTEEVIEMSSTGSISARYVFGLGIDEPVVMWDGSGVSNSNRRFFRADPQGSIIALTDQRGTMVDTYTYSPYGEPDDPSGQPIRYTGRRWDPETGLYYYRARYYNPSLGRFLQTDPVGYGDNTNLYAYVGNDPMNATDPTGTDECPGEPSGSCFRADNFDPNDNSGRTSTIAEDSGKEINENKSDVKTTRRPEKTAKITRNKNGEPKLKKIRSKVRNATVGPLSKNARPKQSNSQEQLKDAEVQVHGHPLEERDTVVPGEGDYDSQLTLGIPGAVVGDNGSGEADEAVAGVEIVEGRVQIRCLECVFDEALRAEVQGRADLFQAQEDNKEED